MSGTLPQGERSVTFPLSDKAFDALGKSQPLFSADFAKRIALFLQMKPSHGAAAGSALGALGIVYGDIGTSVLYAFRECLAHGVEHQRRNPGNSLTHHLDPHATRHNQIPHLCHARRQPG